MSEYQFYEFLALDRPLTPEEQARLRRVSSRAEISPVGFRNEYHRGDLKGNPLDLLAESFDVHVYLANWGSRRFAVRLPAGTFDRDEVASYGVEVSQRKGCLLLDLVVETEEDYLEPADALTGSLAPLRADLLAGDLRWLYLAWLANGDVEAAASGPPVPAGLGQLSGALEAFVDFFRVDRDLVAAAAEVSPPLAAGPDVQAAAKEWVGALSDQERREMLASMLCDPERVAATHGLFQTWLRRRRPKSAVGPRKSWDELAERAAEIREARELEQELRRRARREEREKRNQELRAAHLEAVSAREAEFWADVEAGIGARNVAGYAAAVQHLVDLREVLSAQGREGEFRERVGEIRRVHRLKGNLLVRMDAAGLQGEPALPLRG